MTHENKEGKNSDRKKKREIEKERAHEWKNMGMDISM